MVQRVGRREFLSGVCAAAAASLAPASSRAAPLQPRWAPPDLADPLTVEVVDGKTSYGTYPADRDLMVVLPKAVRTKPVAVYGGRNVRVVGGHLAPQLISGSKYALRFGHLTGSAFVEGVLIDGASEHMDGIAAYGKKGTKPDIYIQNCRIVNITGTYEGVHGDIFQAQGPLGTIRIDGLTGSSDYQGLFIPNQFGITKAEISRTDLTAALTPTTGTWTHLLWLADTCKKTYPVMLSEVWCVPRPGQHLGICVHPRSDSSGTCAATLSPDQETLWWPERTRISGFVRAGLPPTGSFVPEGVAGVDYVSPGYEASTKVGAS